MPLTAPCLANLRGDLAGDLRGDLLGGDAGCACAASSEAKQLRRQHVRGGALLLGLAQRCGDVEG